ncbi:MAG: HD domain-containing protein [Cyanobacteria bacterium P01_F01_bin.42]
MSTSRTYHDPLHGAITLRFDDPVERLLIELIDTPEFQRLRRIRQLGNASLTFHGAEGSRFTHSLGAMYVARRAFNCLCDRHSELKPYRVQVLCGALLHDLGHGPFSHTSEEIFQTHHEEWTCRIIEHSPRVRDLLDDFDSGLGTDLRQVYQQQFHLPLVSQLITSQLDCDRLDYLMRDSYFTGASYGRLDLDRILLAMDYDSESQELVIARKGLAAIEHYLIVRYFMYVQVYNHSKNIAAAWGLSQIFIRAAELLALDQLSTDGVMSAWLATPESLSLKQYLDADDGVFSYHLQSWCDHDDPLLRDLCRRYRDRNLLMCRDISHCPETEQQALLEQVQQRVAQLGWLPHCYAGIRYSTTSGYTLYQRGIKVQLGDRLAGINDLSPLVQALTQPLKKVWLVYPREIGELK